MPNTASREKVHCTLKNRRLVVVAPATITWYLTVFIALLLLTTRSLGGGTEQLHMGPLVESIRII